MQRLRGQPVQHQPKAGRYRREGHHRVFVVEQAEVMRFMQDARDVKGHGLVQLQRIRSAPEIVVGQEELVEGSIDFNCRLRVNRVRPTVRELAYRERAVGDAVEVDLRRRFYLNPALAQLAVQLNDEVKEIEIMLEEKIVKQVFQIARSELVKLRLNGWNVARDESQNLGADVKMAHDQEIGLRSDEIFQPPVDQTVKKLR